MQCHFVRYPVLLALAMTLVPTLVSSVRAADWPQWRGPFFNGSSDEKNLPSVWSETENVAWTADLPGDAPGTPIICGNRVFLSGVDLARDMLQAMCFDRINGKLLWCHDVAKGIRREDRSNYASASPVTDGKVVVFFYANGDLVCFNVDGCRRWARNIQKDYGTFAFFWTPGGSPLLFDGRLYVQVLQRNAAVDGRGFADRENEAYLLALDPLTGDTLWRHVRPSDAVAEAREAHTTPIPLLSGERPQLLIGGGDAITGHDPATGKELWRWGDYNPNRIQIWPLVASPVAAEGVALVCVPKGQPVYAIKTDGSGALDSQAIAWTTKEEKKITTEVPTPAFYDGDFFILSDSRKCIARVAAKTGEVKWNTPLSGAKYEASPLAADGKIYLLNFDGVATVLDAAKGEVLHQAAMQKPADGELVRASIAASHGQLFIRTTRKLYCVGTASGGSSR